MNQPWYTRDVSDVITKPPVPTTELNPVQSLRVLRQVYPPTHAQTWILSTRVLVIGREPGDGGIVLAGNEASRSHAQIKPVKGNGHSVCDLQSRNGTFVNGSRIAECVLENGSVLRIGRAIFVYVACELPPGAVFPVLNNEKSVGLSVVEALADRAAKAGLPVLIYGETGAGKERMAERIHKQSGRSGQLVSLNCGALNSELIGSELFGHLKGAFSGAHGSRTGLFAAANKGTLFLDEIAELPMEQQPALLRACEQGTIRPVGADRDVSVDVRLVAATHKDLAAAVDANSFRADLLARLRGITIRLPPLRERRDEILAIFVKFVDGLSFGLTVAEKLLLHPWPENVRELKNVSQYVRLFAEQSGAILPSHLPEQFVEKAPQTASPSTSRSPSRPGSSKRPHVDKLRDLLKAYKGNISQVAAALGVHRQQAYRWIQREGLKADDFRDSETIDSDQTL